jgi:hypothetical protein
MNKFLSRFVSRRALEMILKTTERKTMSHRFFYIYIAVATMLCSPYALGQAKTYRYQSNDYDVSAYAGIIIEKCEFAEMNWKNAQSRQTAKKCLQQFKHSQNEDVSMAIYEQIPSSLSIMKKKTVHMAVKQYGQALASADESFKKDKETVLLALESNGALLCELDESVKIDTLLLQKALVSSLGQAMQCLQPKHRLDENLALIALAASQYNHEFFATQSFELIKYAVPLLVKRLKIKKENQKEQFEEWEKQYQKNDSVLKMIDFDLRYNKAFLLKASVFYPAAKVWLERL